MRFIIVSTIVLLLTACSSNPKPTLTPQQKFERGLKYSIKSCNEGLGYGGACEEVAKKYENPPAGVMPDFFKSSLYYNYAKHAFKKDCDKGLDPYNCVQLSNFYREGKGGTDKDIGKAHALYKKACTNIHLKEHKICRYKPVWYKEYERGQESKKHSEYLRQNPCSLGWVDYTNARMACKNKKYINPGINFNVCYQSELRKILRKQGCKQ